jgi:hypothetical protein
LGTILPTGNLGPSADLLVLQTLLNNGLDLSLRSSQSDDVNLLLLAEDKVSNALVTLHQTIVLKNS